MRLKTPAGAGPRWDRVESTALPGARPPPLPPRQPRQSNGRNQSKGGGVSPPPADRFVAPKGMAGKTRLRPPLMALLGRAPLHLDAAEVLHCKKGLHRTDGPDSARHRGWPPSFYKGCPATALKRRGEKVHSPRADTARPPLMPTPPSGPHRRGGLAGNLCVFPPLFLRAETATRIKSKPSPPYKGGRPGEKTAFRSRRKTTCKKSVKTCGFQNKAEKSPLLAPDFSVFHYTLHIFYRNFGYSSKHPFFFFLLCKYVNVV